MGHDLEGAFSEQTPLEGVKGTVRFVVTELNNPDEFEGPKANFTFTPGEPSQAITMPANVEIIARDDHTGARYNIGEIALEEGASLGVPARELPLRIRGARLDNRTPEQRLADVRMSLAILRAAGELPGDGD